LDFLQAPLEVSTFRIVPNKAQRVSITGCRASCVSDSPQQFGAGGVKQMKILEVVACYESLNHFECLWSSLNHCDSDGSIQ
jgi:hypothetical protein